MGWRGKKRQVEQLVRTAAAETGRLARAIHSLAEPPFLEVESSRLLAEYLDRAGFRVGFDFRRIPTAFRAVWGRGKPVVGVLGEFDALPDCGQAPDSWGHGCGHNLLGVGSALAATLVKAALAARGRRGTVVYYGCPAEEALAGKVYMARDGAFRELDACIAWHPGAGAGVRAGGGSALDSLVYEFFGRTAHGAHAEGGRSALDAAILMDVAVNYLREHVPENVRIHSVIPEGGDAPNVVPAYAKIWYYLRGQDREQVDGIRKRMDACARGAALATETTPKITRLTAVYSRLPNETFAEVMLDNLRLFRAPAVTSADRKRAKQAGLSGQFNVKLGGISRKPGRASSDEDNVSWLAPLGGLAMVCYPKGVRGHHRTLAAQADAPFALRGMRQAAKVMAGAALDLCADPALMRRIKAEFRRRLGGFVYKPLIPKRQKIPVAAKP